MTTAELFDAAMRSELSRCNCGCLDIDFRKVEVTIGPYDEDKIAFDAGREVGDEAGYERGKAESDQRVHESAVKVGLIVGFFFGMFITLFIQWVR